MILIKTQNTKTDLILNIWNFMNLITNITKFSCFTCTYFLCFSVSQNHNFYFMNYQKWNNKNKNKLPTPHLPTPPLGPWSLCPASYAASFSSPPPLKSFINAPLHPKPHHHPLKLPNLCLSCLTLSTLATSTDLPPVSPMVRWLEYVALKHCIQLAKMKMTMLNFELTRLQTLQRFHHCCPNWHSLPLSFWHSFLETPSQ